MKIEYREGDLFSHPFSKNNTITFLSHVCNSHGAMGSGFVVPLTNKFPKVRSDYLQWANQNDSLKPFELGQTQFVECESDGENLVVCNMVAQTLGGDRPLFYNKLANCMDDVARLANSKQIQSDCKVEIVAPLFGAGLAKGNWLFIEELIQDCWSDFTVFVYYLPDNLPHNWTPPNFHN